MSITASDKGGGDFELPPTGNHPARCVRIIDLGTQESNYQGQVSWRHQVFLAFELPNEMKTYEKDGQQVSEPFLATEFYTLSLNEKAKLCHLLEGWRGKGFTEEEKAGFDITVLAGKPCLLNIVPYISETGNTRVRLTASMLPKGIECPPQVNPTIIFSLEDFDQQVFDNLSDGLKRIIQQSDEYRVMTGQVGQRPEVKEPRPTEDSPPIDGYDDIPF